MSDTTLLLLIAMIYLAPRVNDITAHSIVLACLLLVIVLHLNEAL